MPRIFAKTRRGLRPGPFGFKTAAALALMTLVFGIGYLAQIGSASAKGDRIRSLEKDIAGLKTEKEKLELQLADGQSVRAVSKKVEGLGMVATVDVDYVSPTAPVVAKR